MNESNSSSEYSIDVDVFDVDAFIPRENYTEIFYKSGAVIYVKENMEQIRKLQSKQKQILFG